MGSFGRENEKKVKEAEKENVYESVYKMMVPKIKIEGKSYRSIDQASHLFAYDLSIAFFCVN
jgi:hypothetical protein